MPGVEAQAQARGPFAERLAARALRAAPDGFLAVDRGGLVVGCNAAAERLLGRAAEELLGRPVEGAGQGLDRLLAARPGDGDVPLTLPGPAGAGVPLWARVGTLEVDGAEVRTAFLREAGAPASQRFAAALDRHVARGRPFRVVVVARMDNLHDLADALGHEEVAGILDVLAGRAQDALPGAVVARLAGDEVAAVLEAATEPAREVGRRLVEALGASVEVGGLLLALEVSAGLAEQPCDAGEPAALVQCARRAARAARDEGSGFRLFDATLDAAGPPRAQVAAEFSRALDSGDVAFAYQPQLDLGTGAIVGVEALARWRHAERGLLGPASFLPAIERSPLMRRLALAALEDAVARAARWRAAGLELTVAVNLSVLNLLDLGIAHDLARLLARHRVPPAGLTLEVTEDALMLDPPRTVSILGGLHAMGVGLAVDDFGTGYSSLAYLQRLPVHELKIDRSFVRHVADRPRDAALVRSILGLARGLGLRCVAEGVETAEQERVLREAGCQLAQGFGVARPMAPDALEAWARERSA
jgi:EAL domain-containing protein (putative c-di-GMP-specific phosphodiesterase class I)